MFSFRIYHYLSEWKFWFGVGAFSYGMVAVLRFARGKIKRKKNGELPLEAIVHVIAWTFGPPLWFAFESVLFDASEGGQKLAGSIWAAVLVAILFLVREVK